MRGFPVFPRLTLPETPPRSVLKTVTRNLFLCVRPEWNREDWALELERWRREDGWKLIRSHLARHVVRSVADMICDLSECYEVKACNLPAVQRDTLLDNLTALPLTVYGAGPMGKAMAMRGGVSLKEIHPATLESRLVKGLYFAGEILDLAGPCGGYNMQGRFLRQISRKPEKPSPLNGGRCLPAEVFFLLKRDHF